MTEEVETRLPRVLVVDDETMNLRVFVRLFRKDFEISQATSGADALERLSTGPVDIVLTDYGMRPMTGTVLLEEVRERYPDVRRALVTAYVDHKNVTDALASNLAEEVIPKPYTPDQILQCVASLMDARCGD